MPYSLHLYSQKVSLPHTAAVSIYVSGREGGRAGNRRPGMDTSLPHYGHDTHCIVVQGASSLPMHAVFSSDCVQQMPGNCLTRLECYKKSSLVAVLHFKVFHKQTLPPSHDQLW